MCINDGALEAAFYNFLLLGSNAYKGPPFLFLSETFVDLSFLFCSLALHNFEISTWKCEQCKFR